jgi:hypothetical protein
MFIADTARQSANKLQLIPVTSANAGTAVKHSEAHQQHLLAASDHPGADRDAAGESVISTNLQLSRVKAGFKLIEFGLVKPVDVAKEAFGRIKDLIVDFKNTTKAALELLVPFVIESAEGLIGGANLDASLPRRTAMFAFGIRPGATDGQVGNIFLGATGINVLAGVGGDTATTADDKGVQLSNGRLGFALFSDLTYALEVSGSATLVGITDLTLAGSLKLRANTAGDIDSNPDPNIDEFCRPGHSDRCDQLSTSTQRWRLSLAAA